MIKVATVFERDCPFFIILKHKGTIYVCIKKLIAVGSLYLTRAPITPREVTLRFSNILVFVEVFKNGYKNKGIWAEYYNVYRLKITDEFDDVVLNIVKVQQLNKSYSMRLILN